MPQDLVNQVISFTKHVVHKGRRVEPTLFTRHGNEVRIVNLSPLPHKDLWSGFMRMLIETTEPDEYVFTVESWVRIFDPEREDERRMARLVADGKKQVSELSDKTECIIVTHGYEKQKERMGMVQFKRVTGGKIEFKEVLWHLGTVEGILTNLWNPSAGGDRIH